MESTQTMTRITKTKKTDDRRRPDRVASQVLEELSRALVRDLSDPRLVNVTLTKAEATPDLQQIFVGVRALTDDAKYTRSKAAAVVLTRAEGGLRRTLGEKLVLRRVPRLQFNVDVGFEQAAHFAQVMDEVSREVKSLAARPQDPDKSGE